MRGEKPFISVVIPNRDGAKTLGPCLEAACTATYSHFEVVVVDDCSRDNSRDIIGRHPCTLVRLDAPMGASAARNRGAEAAQGEVLFFIDADCVIRKDSLIIAAEAFREGVVVGGTYTPLSYDRGFYSDFQSVFIHYSETKRTTPDYVAAHAMVVSRRLFLEAGGFPEDFLPILEDVEFSHRVRRMGIRLEMERRLMVQHAFHFSLWSSLGNAFRKTRYWTVYSIRNRDLLKDSGTASIELKTNTFSWSLCILLLVGAVISGKTALATSAGLVFLLNIFVNRNLMGAMARIGGAFFLLKALLYYAFVYPSAVAAGGLYGTAASVRR